MEKEMERLIAILRENADPVKQALVLAYAQGVFGGDLTRAETKKEDAA